MVLLIHNYDIMRQQLFWTMFQFLRQDGCEVTPFWLLARSPSPNLTLPGNCNYVLSNKIHLTGFYHACVWFDFYLHFLQRKDVKYSKGYCNPSLHSWTSQHYDHGDSQMDDTACWRTSRFIKTFLHDMWLLKEKRLKIIFIIL